MFAGSGRCLEPLLSFRRLFLCSFATRSVAQLRGSLTRQSLRAGKLTTSSGCSWKVPPQPQESALCLLLRSLVSFRQSSWAGSKLNLLWSSLLRVARVHSILGLHTLWEHSAIPAQPSFLACHPRNGPDCLVPKISRWIRQGGHCARWFSWE